MNSWIKFLISKKWNILTFIITLVVGVLLYIYDKKKDSKAVRITNLCQMVSINFINIMKCFKLSFSNCCCCCIRKNNNKNLQIKKNAKKLIDSMKQEIDILIQLKNIKDGESKMLLSSLQDNNEKRNILYKKEVEIEVKKKEEKK